MQRLRSLLSVVATIVAEVAALAFVIDLGSAPWAAIGWRDPGVWLATAAPADALAATLRAVAIAALVWLLLATMLQIVLTMRGRTMRIPGLPSGLRHRLDASIAALVATTTLATPAVAVAAPGLPEHIPVPVQQSVPAVPHDPASPRDLPAPRDDAAEPPAAATIHTVVAGDHLWAIAEQHVRSHDPTASDHEVATYWRRVVEANLDLPSGDPDLIHPGEQVVLPPQSPVPPARERNDDDPRW